MPARSELYRVAFTAAVVAVLALPLPGIARQSKSQFSSAVRLVPVDVRVLDSRRQPITDLTIDDFTVKENGVVQTISHFSAHALEPGTPEPDAARLLRNASRSSLEPQNHRVFLIMMGRGRIHGPSKGLDGAIHFVRERLLPQDLVAVFAWNRATEFTTDHGRVAGLLERFRTAHDEVEALMKQRFSGLAAVYGSRAIPESLQARIDRIFDGPEGLRVRSAPSSETLGIERLTADRFAAGLDALVASGRQGASAATQGFLRSTSELDLLNRPEVDILACTFDEYVRLGAQSSQDVTNVYAGIQYLRFMPGEKHLVLFSEAGLYLPREEHERALAAAANDARVAIDTIQTGGLIGGILSESWNSIRGLRHISDLTGGVAHAYTWADKAVNRLADATSFQYLIGYYPTNAEWDGRYRNIEVKVKRRGVRVHYRHGYFAQDDPPPLDRRAIVTQSRIAGASSLGAPIDDIPIEVEARLQKGNWREVFVDMTIDPSRVHLAPLQGRWVGDLQIVLFAGNVREDLVGQRWQKMEFDLPDISYRHVLTHGIPLRTSIAVSKRAKFIKAIVYDYNADLIGSAIVEIRE